MHADKHGRFLHIQTLTFDGEVNHSQSSQNSMFAMSLQNLKKKLDEVDFFARR